MKTPTKTSVPSAKTGYFGQQWAYGGLIYVTTDWGFTWKTNNAPSANWYSIGSSSNGTKMVAAVFGGLIYTSTNSGANWVSNSAPKTNWASVTTSADGSKLVAASLQYPGSIYTWQAVPALNLAVTNGGFLLSWPSLASTTNYLLHQNGDLTTTNWVAATNQTGVTNGQYQALVSPQSGNEFYRLQQSP